MTELKTFKDIEKSLWNGICCFLERDLKAEAVKWVKWLKIGKIRDNLSTSDWIKHFFNLTEEDLK